MPVPTPVRTPMPTPMLLSLCLYHTHCSIFWLSSLHDCQFAAAICHRDGIIMPPQFSSEQIDERREELRAYVHERVVGLAARGAPSLPQ
jgi:hypothetical protein